MENPLADILPVIPAYEPTDAFPPLVRRLADRFGRCLVVDDGSRRQVRLFEGLADAPGVRLLRHPANRGKGAALRTAFAAVLADVPDCRGVVTLDADGQHLLDDVVRVAEALAAHSDRFALGVRDFGRGVPFRSRLGNLWTRAEFRLLAGVAIRDTQTGLRGIPRAFLPRLLALPGDRYEYESRMLVFAARLPEPPVQVPIATVYADGNGSSHYRPLADTLLTQRSLLDACFRRL